MRTILQKNQSINTKTINFISTEGQVVNLDFPRERTTPRDLTLNNVIRNIEKGLSTKNPLNNLCEAMTLVSQVEPKNFTEALQDEN